MRLRNTQCFSLPLTLRSKRWMSSKVVSTAKLQLQYTNTITCQHRLLGREAALLQQLAHCRARDACVLSWQHSEQRLSVQLLCLQLRYCRCCYCCLRLCPAIAPRAHALRDVVVT